jgi:hypothetical protein
MQQFSVYNGKFLKTLPMYCQSLFDLDEESIKEIGTRCPGCYYINGNLHSSDMDTLYRWLLSRKLERMQVEVWWYTWPTLTKRYPKLPSTDGDYVDNALKWLDTFKSYVLAVHEDTDINDLDRKSVIQRYFERSGLHFEEEDLNACYVWEDCSCYESLQ